MSISTVSLCLIQGSARLPCIDFTLTLKQDSPTALVLIAGKTLLAGFEGAAPLSPRHHDFLLLLVGKALRLGHVEEDQDAAYDRDGRVHEEDVVADVWGKHLGFQEGGQPV
jgi:hypothetical protein